MGILKEIQRAILKEATENVTDNIKRRGIRIAEFSVLLFLGLFLIVFGFAKVLESYFEILSGGVGHLVLGILLIVVGFIIEKI